MTHVERRQRLASEAKFWCTSEQQIRAWRKLSLPTGDPHELARQLLANKRTHAKYRARALEVLSKVPPTEEDQAKAAAEDFKVEKELQKSSLSMVQDLEQEAIRYQQMQRKAQATGDMALGETALDSRMKVYRNLIGIRKELRKFGEDAGKLIAREEVERIILAMGMTASASISRLQEDLGEELIDLKRVEQAVNVLEPHLVRGLFLSPFVGAARYASASGLPQWVVDALKRACGDAIENGEAEFDTELEKETNQPAEAAIGAR